MKLHILINRYYFCICIYMCSRFIDQSLTYFFQSSNFIYVIKTYNSRNIGRIAGTKVKMFVYGDYGESDKCLRFYLLCLGIR